MFRTRGGIYYQYFGIELLTSRLSKLSDLPVMVAQTRINRGKAFRSGKKCADRRLNRTRAKMAPVGLRLKFLLRAIYIYFVPTPIPPKKKKEGKKKSTTFNNTPSPLRRWSQVARTVSHARCVHAEQIDVRFGACVRNRRTHARA